MAGKSHQNTHRSVIQPFPNAVKLRNVPIALAVFVLWKLECHVDQRADEAAGQATLQNISSGGHCSDIKDAHRNINPENKLKK